ncbi:UNVERIFIED_CONTAM: hypothetical protein Sradi_5294900 [Sesamum radiatum]|uniref:Retrovirus-related Pol polyprotein from transposon TNT 1-94-like beta-barrel domain-containing protein n=1 Tax=Sesamum radiatum TaxID=300843 RepID=A0AAW2LPA8_SESRA
MIYRIQREISSISQKDLSLTAYVTKVKKLWNEFFCLSPTPKCKCGGCTCGINKAIADRDESTQLMQFLMGLHESFDSERSQILMQDPLPDIERAFSMIFAVEKQRAVQIDLAESPNHLAYQLNLKDNKREGADRFIPEKKTYQDKRSLICSHCHRSGHSHETCFQLHGVPEWYKSLNDKKKKGVSTRSFAATVDGNHTTVAASSTANVADFMTELMKFMKRSNIPSDPVTDCANFVQYDEEFAGNTSKPSENELCSWIIDTGATNHICANLALFHSYTKPLQPQFIHLPDGTKSSVSYIGTVRLNDLIILKNVLFIPTFSVNLISVSQLCVNSSYSFHFSQNTCFLQDRDTKHNLVQGYLCKKLYIFRQKIPISCSSVSVNPQHASCSDTM